MESTENDEWMNIKDYGVFSLKDNWLYNTNLTFYWEFIAYLEVKYVKIITQNIGKVEFDSFKQLTFYINNTMPNLKWTLIR